VGLRKGEKRAVVPGCCTVFAIWGLNSVGMLSMRIPVFSPAITEKVEQTIVLYGAKLLARSSTKITLPLVNVASSERVCMQYGVLRLRSSSTTTVLLPASTQ
jgi:hypothetical protein